MRCQNPEKGWEISNAIPNTLFFLCFSQFWSQTRKPKIPDEEFQSDTPRCPKPWKLRRRREISNVGWSQELTEFLTATHVARLQFDSCAEKDSVCRTVMMAWIWHIWINAMVFVPMAQAPPKADAKEVLYSLQSKFDPWVHIHVLNQPDLCRFGKPSYENRQR